MNFQTCDKVKSRYMGNGHPTLNRESFQVAAGATKPSQKELNPMRGTAMGCNSTCPDKGVFHLVLCSMWPLLFKKHPVEIWKKQFTDEHFYTMNSTRKIAGLNVVGVVPCKAVYQYSTRRDMQSRWKVDGKDMHNRCKIHANFMQNTHKRFMQNTHREKSLQNAFCVRYRASIIAKSRRMSSCRSK